MQETQRLLARLDAIGVSLKHSGTALALLGLGSVGVETERLDTYSDLDFFVIVKPGLKPRYLQNLDWLAAVHPLAYYFLNTEDGYKALFADGIFCEFAIFEPQELASIPFANGRFIWKDGTFDASLCVPLSRRQPERTQEWMLGEALTNLYVGMGRVHRGEILSGTRFIQTYAIDHVLELTAYLESARSASEDPFAKERRYERRYPQTARHLPSFMQGYSRNAESALALLQFLEQHFEINPAMSAAIQQLCTRSSSNP